MTTERDEVTPTEEDAQETAWLVEMPGPVWWNGGPVTDGMVIWTPNSLHAVRFARKTDAEAIITRMQFWNAHATEHIWGFGPDPLARARAEGERRILSIFDDYEDPCLTYEQAMARWKQHRATGEAIGARAEREAVVRWLRAVQTAMRRVLSTFKGDHLATKPRAYGRMRAYGVAAAAIERGDHLSTEPPAK